MSLPLPPYTYDDPRLTYDEVCFFYDGGYDSVCLSTGTIFVGKATASSSSSSKKKKLDKPFINIFIEAKLLEVNGVLIDPDEPSTWFRFSGETDVIDIYINNIRIDISKPMIEGKFMEIVKNIIGYSGSFESNGNRKEEIDVTSEVYVTTNKDKKDSFPVISKVSEVDSADNLVVVCERIITNDE